MLEALWQVTLFNFCHWLVSLFSWLSVAQYRFSLYPQKGAYFTLVTSYWSCVETSWTYPDVTNRFKFSTWCHAHSSHLRPSSNRWFYYATSAYTPLIELTNNIIIPLQKHLQPYLTEQSRWFVFLFEDNFLPVHSTRLLNLTSQVCTFFLLWQISNDWIVFIMVKSSLFIKL